MPRVVYAVSTYCEAGSVRLLFLWPVGTYYTPINYIPESVTGNFGLGDEKYGVCSLDVAYALRESPYLVGQGRVPCVPVFVHFYKIAIFECFAGLVVDDGVAKIGVPRPLTELEVLIRRSILAGETAGAVHMQVRDFYVFPLRVRCYEVRAVVFSLVNQTLAPAKRDGAIALILCDVWGVILDGHLFCGLVIALGRLSGDALCRLCLLDAIGR